MSEARELDAWLAEHLFGFTVGTDPWSVNHGGLGKLAGNPRPRKVPRAASTADGMLLVLEAMRARGWTRFALYCERIPGRCEAVISTESRDFHAEGESFPFAVATAAKAALETEIKLGTVR